MITQRPVIGSLRSSGKFFSSAVRFCGRIKPE
jgi:hypothetical protein